MLNHNIWWVLAKKWQIPQQSQHTVSHTLRYPTDNTQNKNRCNKEHTSNYHLVEADQIWQHKTKKALAQEHDRTPSSRSCQQRPTTYATRRQALHSFLTSSTNQQGWVRKGARRGGRAGLPCHRASSPLHGELARPQRGEAGCETSGWRRRRPI